MPKTEVVFYVRLDRTCPAMDWLKEQSDDVRDKLMYRVFRLEQAGHTLRARRPIPSATEFTSFA